MSRRDRRFEAICRLGTIRVIDELRHLARRILRRDTHPRCEVYEITGVRGIRTRRLSMVSTETTHTSTFGMVRDLVHAALLHDRGTNGGS